MGFSGSLLPGAWQAGQEYSIFLNEYRPGLFDWANTNEAAGALSELTTRLSMEPRRFRMTRAELERYGSMAPCNVPRLAGLLRDRRGRPRGDPNILIRGSWWIKNADLCGWAADELDLVEWGDDPCSEVSMSLAHRLLIDCGANPSRSTGLNAIVRPPRTGWVALWPRN